MEDGGAASRPASRWMESKGAGRPGCQRGDGASTVGLGEAPLLTSLCPWGAASSGIRWLEWLRPDLPPLRTFRGVLWVPAFQPPQGSWEP